MIIRDFNLSDLDDVVNIEFNAFSDPYPVNVLIQLHDLGAGFLVAQVNQKVVGYVIFWVKNGFGHIVAIAVDQKFQDMHIGSSLLENALSIFKRNHIDIVRLEVRESNIKARRFYQKMGFVQIAVEEEYYDDGEAAIIMQYSNYN